MSCDMTPPATVSFRLLLAVLFRGLGGAQSPTSVPVGYDAAVVSPVFFGYTSTTEQDMDEACTKVGK